MAGYAAIVYAAMKTKPTGAAGALVPRSSAQAGTSSDTSAIARNPRRASKSVRARTRKPSRSIAAFKD